MSFTISCSVNTIYSFSSQQLRVLESRAPQNPLRMRFFAQALRAESVCLHTIRFHSNEAGWWMIITVSLCIFRFVHDFSFTFCAPFTRKIEIRSKVNVWVRERAEFNRIHVKLSFDVSLEKRLCFQMDDDCSQKTSEPKKRSNTNSKAKCRKSDFSALVLFQKV